MAFFVFLAFYAKWYYQMAVVRTLSKEWRAILDNRLLVSSQSVSTAHYFMDKAFIDSMVRLSDIYRESLREPFPIKDGTYSIATDADFVGGETLSGSAAYCDFPDNANTMA